MKNNSRALFSWNKEKRGEAARPFRLYDEKHQKNVAHSCFGTLEKARNKAILHTAFSKTGECYTVYDCRNQKLHWQFVKRVRGEKAFVDILPGDMLL